ncbi:MAG: NHLP bacteriocin system secretion protein [Chlorobiaceae bacterium]|nr:NHLP bacteriocin system secretion protein [Chlorobiaceae bacterium]
MAVQFRKEALRKLSSPDDLDRLMPVTDRRGWLALAAAGLFIASAIAWGLWGKISTTVDGRGMTMASGAIRNITSRTGGVISGFDFKGGEPVQKGQVLAIVEHPELRQLFFEAFSRYEFLASHEAEKRAFIMQQIDLQEKKFASLKRRHGEVKEARFNAAERELMELKNSLYNLDENLSTAQRQLDKAREDYKWRSAVIAPFSGIVTEVQANNGEQVAPGQQLLQIEPYGNSLDEELRLDLYVASGNAKKIRNGMDVYIAPAVIKPEENGYIIGRVYSVSEYPVSVEAIAAEIRNQQMANSLASESPPYKVKVVLLKDSGSYSGYRWTSGKGPRVKITSGILCAGKIVIEQQHPVELVVPLLKKYVLGEAR